MIQIKIGMKRTGIRGLITFHIHFTFTLHYFSHVSVKIPQIRDTSVYWRNVKVKVIIVSIEQTIVEHTMLC